ncbi:MAG: AAA family ATPase [Pyrinomonadaceae bacterium]
MLQAIKNLTNVNALASGQEINIGPNLTVVYGNNGSGKSGYVRILNNVFPSRGDKEILPNVFATPNGQPPGCQFTFQRTELPYDLSYPSDKEKYEFAQFAVFDTASVRAHLSNENQLSFTPSGFEVFESLMQGNAGIHEKLKAEADAKSAPHDFGSVFTNENEVKAFVDSLGPETTAEELEILCSLDDDANKKIDKMKARLEQLKAADKSQQVNASLQARTQLDEFCSRASKALEPFRSEKVSVYLTAIDSVVKFEELARAKGLQSLQKYDIAGIGSPSWREFIRAGNAYATAIEKERNDNKYPANGDKCLFCLQPLVDEQTELIEAYWDLLKSQTEAELNKAKAALATIRREIIASQPLVFDQTSTVFKTVNTFDPKLAEKWQKIVTLIAETRTAVTVAIDELDKSKLPVGIDALVTEFDACGEKLDGEKAALIASNPKEEITQLEVDIELHNDRVLLAKLRDKVQEHIETLKWVASARKRSPGSIATKITKLQGGLYENHVTEEYIAYFNEECRNLNAPSFVEVAQRNTKGNTLRKLEIAKYKAAKVLSEGEQRAIAIADFITEARMNPHNRGLIFDDPVSSQDHERRELIANRLVEHAKMKQVIVFTHDIVFFHRLMATADDQKVSLAITTVRKISETPGIVMPELPFSVQRVKARIRWLRDRLVKLTKLEKEGNQDEFFMLIKGWYGHLRETWERTVEECVFNDVIQRYNPRVQTKRLEDVRIDDELISELTKAMTSSSNWVHDSAPADNPSPPSSNQAQTDLGNLEAFVQKCQEKKPS